MFDRYLSQFVPTSDSQPRRTSIQHGADSSSAGLFNIAWGSGTN